MLGILLLARIILLGLIAIFIMIKIANNSNECISFFMGMGIAILILWLLFVRIPEVLEAPPYTNLVKSEQIVAMSDKYITTNPENYDEIEVLYFTKEFDGRAIVTNTISCNKDDVLILTTDKNFRLETYSNEFGHYRYVFYLPKNVANSELLTKYVINEEAEETILEVYKNMFLNRKGRLW